MKVNMGTADRLIRTGIAVIVGVLIISHVLSGTAALILGILAIVFILTSFVGTCPLYMPFKFSTCSKTK
jgi:hypothetical protein